MSAPRKFTPGVVIGSLKLVRDVGSSRRGRIWLCKCANSHESQRHAVDLARGRASCRECHRSRHGSVKSRPPAAPAAPAAPARARAKAPRRPEDLGKEDRNTCRRALATWCLLLDDVAAWTASHRPPQGSEPMSHLIKPSDVRVFPSWFILRHAGGACPKPVDRFWHVDGGGCLTRSRGSMSGGKAGRRRVASASQ